MNGFNQINGLIFEMLPCIVMLLTKWTDRGNSSTPAFLRPRSKIRILGSGTPLETNN